MPKVNLSQAIADYKGYLNTGEPCYLDGTDCVRFYGVESVKRLQGLRKTLHDACERASNDARLEPAVDVLATSTVSVLKIDPTVNGNVIHFKAHEDEQSAPFVESVRASVVEVLNRTQARLPSARKTKGRRHGADRIPERAMPMSIGTYVAGDVNYASQGSNIAARSPSSGQLTQSTAGVAKPNRLTLVWQLVRKVWSAFAAVKGWYPAIMARIGAGQ